MTNAFYSLHDLMQYTDIHPRLALTYDQNSPDNCRVDSIRVTALFAKNRCLHLSDLPAQHLAGWHCFGVSATVQPSSTYLYFLAPQQCQHASHSNEYRVEGLSEHRLR